MELISFGKPIIDFNYSDSCCDLLKKYPIYLNVNIKKDVAYNLTYLNFFVKDNLNKRAKLEDLLDKYSMNLDDNVQKKMKKIFLES